VRTFRQVRQLGCDPAQQGVKLKLSRAQQLTWRNDSHDFLLRSKKQFAELERKQQAERCICGRHIKNRA